jgi:hypothetical protein
MNTNDDKARADVTILDNLLERATDGDLSRKLTPREVAAIKRGRGMIAADLGLRAYKAQRADRGASDRQDGLTPRCVGCEYNLALECGKYATRERPLNCGENGNRVLA